MNKEALNYAVKHCNNPYEADIAIPAFTAGYKQAIEDAQAEAERRGWEPSYQ
jgi:hypothetical protein